MKIKTSEKSLVFLFLGVKGVWDVVGQGQYHPLIFHFTNTFNSQKWNSKNNQNTV